MGELGASEDLAACPEGFHYRELRAFLRVPEKDSIPPRIWEHIHTCASCSSKWSFLEFTDPIVKEQFEARIRDLAEDILIPEIIFPRRAKTPEVAVAATAARAAAVGVLVPALAIPDAWPASIPCQDAERILNVREPLPPAFVISLFQPKKSVPQEADRERRKAAVALFTRRQDRRHPSHDWVFKTMEKLHSNKTVELSAEEIEVAATLPQTAVADDPPLLACENGKFLFKGEQVPRLRAMIAADY
jgi:hypothetical protein